MAEYEHMDIDDWRGEVAMTLREGFSDDDCADEFGSLGDEDARAWRDHYPDPDVCAEKFCELEGKLPGPLTRTRLGTLASLLQEMLDEGVSEDTPVVMCAPPAQPRLFSDHEVHIADVWHEEGSGKVCLGGGRRAKQREFVYRVEVTTALGWELHKEALGWALVDAAEGVAEQAHPGFYDIETDSTDITVEDDEFVVTFKWTENPDA